MNKFLAAFFTLKLVCLTSCWLYSQNQKPVKIGYAFAGGGAKGIAHIGALKVLEEAGIYPDYVTGTSIGAIIGGLYSIGYSVEELEELALELNWNYYFTDELSRMDLPIEERDRAERYQLKLGIEDGTISLPKGFVQGQKIGLLLSQLTTPAHGIYDFDEFTIPFRCLATDIENGEAVVLKSGSLAKAIRASMSLPSIFEPVTINGKLLIDGGVVQNLPVTEVKEMGANFVIALNITGPLLKKEEVGSLLSVLEQTSSYKLAEGVARERKLTDIEIKPAIDSFGTLDFSRAQELLKRGEEAARAALPQILAQLGEQQRTLARPKKKKSSYRILDVCFDGINDQQEQVFNNLVQIQEDRDYDLQKIEDRIKKLFGSQFFKDAYYEIIPVNEDFYQLDIHATPQSGEYLQVSANYDSDLKSGLLLNATFRNRPLAGSRFSLDLKLSENPVLLTDYLLYTSSRPNIGVHTSMLLNHFPVYFYGNEGQIDEISGISHLAVDTKVFSGLNFQTLASLGIGAERYSQRFLYFKRSSEELQLTQAFLTGKLLFDTFDRKLFPNSGSHISINGKFAFSGSLRPSDQPDQKLVRFNKMITLRADQVIPMGNYLAFRVWGQAGWLENEANNYLNLFYLGRKVPYEWNAIELIGADYMEYPVSQFGLAGVKLRAAIRPSIYGAFLFNYARIKNENYLQVIEEKSTIVREQTSSFTGIGLEGGIVTPLGPIRMTAEYNLTESSTNFSLNLGYLF